MRNSETATNSGVAGSITNEGLLAVSSGAAAASERYRLLCACFQYPDQELADALAAGELDNLLGSAVRPAGDAEDLQVEYTRLFDAVGASGPLCSLSAGDYTENKLRILEDVLRFYDHFGLVPPEQYRVMPDHLTAGLEFLHFLAYAEAELLNQWEDPVAYRRAQRDFLQRQILNWLPRLVEKVVEHRAAEVFQALVASLVKTVDEELRRLETVMADTMQ